MRNRISISQKVRKILDNSFLQKGFLFWLISPILFLISFLVASVGWIKRKKGYSKFTSLPVNVPNSLHVICVGNILIGGTGKTPIVRTFAVHNLNQDHTVAIASRGIAAEKITVNSLDFTQDDIDKLSDENREHFEILKSLFPQKQFFIFQNKNRRQSICEFINILSRFKNKKHVFILDDGLQHFACPRHVNVCVHDKELNQKSPPYSWPIGPYREGFGRESIQRLLSTFDIRIWTNGTIVPNLDKPHDISASYEINLFKIHIDENLHFKLEKMIQTEIIIQKSDQPLIVSGIAHPERFFTDLKKISTDFECCDAVFLPDHGQLNKECFTKIAQSNMVFMTTKDFFRFCTDKKFLKLSQTRSLYACYPEYKSWSGIL